MRPAARTGVDASQQSSLTRLLRPGRTLAGECHSERGLFVVGVRGGRGSPGARRSTMAKYLLSVHSVEGAVRDPMTAEEMQHFMERVGILEQEMESAGAWVFGGRLHEPDTATVVRMSDGEPLTTDGPFGHAHDGGGVRLVQ